MSMTQTQFDKLFGRWVAAVNGSYIDMDGFPPSAPYQCHDVWLSMLVQVFGERIYSGHAPGAGWTDEVFKQFPRYRPELTKHFRKRTGSAGIRNGVVIFWPYGDPNFPWSHVAVALEPPRNGYVRCVTQNPGATQIANLPLSRMLGYLEPIIEAPKPILKWRTNMKSYQPGAAKEQIVKPGEYELVRINSKRDVSIAIGAGIHYVEGQINVIGEPGEQFELTLAVDECESKTGDRKKGPGHKAAETAILGNKGVAKARVTSRIPMKALAKGMDQRVRMYIRNLSDQDMKISYVRYGSSRQV